MLRSWDAGAYPVRGLDGAAYRLADQTSIPARQRDVSGNGRDMLVPACRDPVNVDRVVVR